MSVPTVVQNDSASCREEEEDASSLSPSDSASFDVTLDSAETPSSNPRSAQEHYVSVSNAKQVLFAMAVGLVDVDFDSEPTPLRRENT